MTLSQTTPYNPRGDGQCEKYNGIIWNAITLCLKSKGLSVSKWKSVLPDALHSIRSLLCTTTNETPHERLFNFERKTSTVNRLPEWLTIPGPILVRNRNPHSKYEPKVNDAELIEANPNYARVRYPDGKESSVSLRDLAPPGDGGNTVELCPPETAPQSSNDVSSPTYDISVTNPSTEVECDLNVRPSQHENISSPSKDGQLPLDSSESSAQRVLTPKRPTRIKKPVKRLIENCLIFDET